MKINPNDPAFPGIRGASGCGNETFLETANGPSWIGHNQGMTIRAEIASRVLAGLAAQNRSFKPGDAAKEAVEWTDSLIWRLNK